MARKKPKERVKEEEVSGTEGKWEIEMEMGG